MSDSTDSQCLHAAVRGDREALRQLYERHVDGLYAFVFYRVGCDPQIAQDVVQETFIQVLDHAKGFDPTRGTFRAWLHVCSRGRIRKQLRARRRSLELTWEQIDATLAQVFQALESAPIGDEILERAETRDLVNMTIANLPSNYRVALEHKYIKGGSLRDLAALLSLSESAAKSLLARARIAFRDAFTTMTTAFAEVRDA